MPYYEFIQVDQKHKKAYSDFTDNEDFTVSERLSFLKKYDEFLQKNYGVPKTSKYAIDPYSAEKMCEQMESSVALPEINARSLPDLKGTGTVVVDIPI